MVAVPLSPTKLEEPPPASLPRGLILTAIAKPCGPASKKQPNPTDPCPNWPGPHCLVIPSPGYLVPEPIGFHVTDLPATAAEGSKLTRNVMHDSSSLDSCLARSWSTPWPRAAIMRHALVALKQLAANQQPEWTEQLLPSIIGVFVLR